MKYILASLAILTPLWATEVQAVDSIIKTTFDISGEESLVGVWKGSIGGKPIIACFDRFDGSDYYYLKHFWRIPLVSKDKQKLAWAEGDTEEAGVFWQLKPVTEDRLEGQWSDKEGKRSLPIRLTRIYADTDGKGSCSSVGNAQGDAFNAPRVNAQKVLRTQGKEGEYQYISTLNGAISSIEFTKNTRSFTQINKILRNTFREQVVDYFDCKIPSPLGDSYYEFETLVKFIHKDWLSIDEHYSNQCVNNGGRTNYGTHHRNFELAKGNEVNLCRWFTVYEKEKFGNDTYCNLKAPEKLNKIILSAMQKYAPDDECTEAISITREYALALRDQGILFSPNLSPYLQACNTSAEIPYKKLLPFLTKAARDAVSSLK